MGDDVIAEYGFMHRLDERTRFRSRLSRQELDSHDRRRSVEVAGLLDRSRGSYGAFLREVSPLVDPFAYEARVHLFSRGRRLADGRSAPAGSRPRQEHETAAFREHRILEWAFGRSLAASSFDWPPRRRARLEAAQAPDASYTSPVAAHLITWISEPVLVGLLLTVLTALLATDLALRAVSRSPPHPAP
jgi:hypothetical protein